MGFAITSVLKEYAQGAAMSAKAPIADFLAPTVNVPTTTGQFKRYSEKNRFRIPNTRRSPGGRAVVLGFDADDATFNCTPNSLDVPVEREAASQEEFEAQFRYASDIVSGVGSLAHEKTVIDKALAAAGNGTAKTWNASADPIADLDEQILAVLKAAKYGSLMSVGVLFGANAFRIFKNNPSVRSSFPMGNPKAGNKAVVTQDSVPSLLIGNPEVQTSFMVYDDAVEGKAEDIKFLLDTSILIFARMANPNPYDPSFMKTFRLSGKWMVPGSYQRDDGRAQVAKFDWSEDVQTTNSAAIARLVIS